MRRPHRPTPMPLRAYVIPCVPSLSRMPDVTGRLRQGPHPCPGPNETRRFYSLPGTLARSELRRPRDLRLTSGFGRAARVKRAADPQLVKAIPHGIAPHALVRDEARAPAARQPRNHLRADL